jgi:hypothetical protein
VKREQYLPASLRDVLPAHPLDTDLAIWTWQEPSPSEPEVTHHHVIAFAGKSNRPVLQGTFVDEASRASTIRTLIARRKTRLATRKT